MSDNIVPPTWKQARATVQGLILAGQFVLDTEGLKLSRDESRSPNQAPLDRVLERLVVLGVSEQSMTIAIRRRGGKTRPSAFFELCIDMAGVEHLATIFPAFADALSTLRRGPEAPSSAT
jgi:hypothetical protein